MLDIGWPELTVILVVALLVIGPRDLPKALHSVGKWVRKARSVTREFQRHIDDMVRDADIEEVKQLRQHAGKFSKAGMTRELDKMIDPSGEMRQSMDVKKAFGDKPEAASGDDAEAAADGQAMAADAATGRGAAPKDAPPKGTPPKKETTPKIESKPGVPMPGPGPASADREAQAIIDAKLKAAAPPPAAKPTSSETARRSVGPRRTRSFTRAAREKREAEAAAQKVPTADAAGGADAKAEQPRAAKPRSKAPRTTKPRAAKTAQKVPASEAPAEKPAADKPAAKKPAAKRTAAKKAGAGAKASTGGKAPAAEAATPKRRTRRTPPADKQGGADKPAVSAKPAAAEPSAGTAAPADREG